MLHFINLHLQELTLINIKNIIFNNFCMLNARNQKLQTNGKSYMTIFVHSCTWTSVSVQIRTTCLSYHCNLEYLHFSSKNVSWSSSKLHLEVTSYFDFWVLIGLRYGKMTWSYKSSSMHVEEGSGQPVLKHHLKNS
jgi:hypothetical protein